MKHSGISFFSLPTNQVPNEYWQSHLPSALLERPDRRLRQEQPRPLPRSLAHPPGVRVQPRRRQPAATPTASCSCFHPSARKTRRREGLKGFQTAYAPQPVGQPSAGHAQPQAGSRPFRRPARVRPRRLQRRRRPRPPVDGRGRIQRHSRIRRVHPLHRNPRVRAGHHAQPRDLPNPLRPKVN